MMFTDLPRELELEILVRVPATSLTKLKSTCKLWYTLLKERFIEKNLGKGAVQFILKKDDGVYSASIDLHNSFDLSVEFTGKLITLEDSDHVAIYTIHQCDGLFLCTTKDNRLRVNRLVVWNPCPGQTMWIQPSNRNYKKDQYLLGYENNNKSFQGYKILRSSEAMDEFEIYDFKSDSWRLLDGVTHIWFIRSRGVSLKGSTYWVAWDRCSKPFTNKYLLRFDFKREIFERLSLPYRSNYFDGEFSLSVVREDKLYVFLQKISAESSEMKIWVMETKIDEAEHTNIQYPLVVDFSEIWRSCMKNVVIFESFFVDEETKKVVCCGRDGNDKNKIVIYIVGGDQNLHVCKQVHGDIAQGQYDYWQLPRGSNDYWP